MDINLKIQYNDKPTCIVINSDNFEYANFSKMYVKNVNSHIKVKIKESEFLIKKMCDEISEVLFKYLKEYKLGVKNES